MRQLHEGGKVQAACPAAMRSNFVPLKPAGTGVAMLQFFRAFQDSRDLWDTACVLSAALELWRGGSLGGANKGMIAAEAAALEVRIKADERISPAEKARLIRESGLAALNPRLEFELAMMDANVPLGTPSIAL